MKVLNKAALIDSMQKTIEDGMMIAVGGFGLSGNPFDLIDALVETGKKNLTIVSNNMGIDGLGLGKLLANGQVSKVYASYVGENQLFAKQYMAGNLQVEFTPQGTLAEKLRAGGAGIPAFYTATGVGTEIAKGKPVEVFNGKEYLLEEALVPDISLVHAFVGDETGNLRYRLAARNFNPVCAEAGKICYAEVEHLVGKGDLPPDDVMTPGVYVSHVLECEPRDKPIEKVTIRK